MRQNQCLFLWSSSGEAWPPLKRGPTSFWKERSLSLGEVLARQRTHTYTGTVTDATRTRHRQGISST